LPCPRELEKEGPVTVKGRVEAKHGEEGEKNHGAPGGEDDRRQRDDRHRPEVDLAPATVGPAALRREHRNRRDDERERAGRDVDETDGGDHGLHGDSYLRPVRRAVRAPSRLSVTRVQSSSSSTNSSP